RTAGWLPGPGGGDGSVRPELEPHEQVLPPARWRLGNAVDRAAPVHQRVAIRLGPRAAHPAREPALAVGQQGPRRDAADEANAMAARIDPEHEHTRGVDRAVRLPVHEGAAVVEHLDVAIRQPMHVVLPAEHPARVVPRDVELVALAAEDPLRPPSPAI